MRKGKNSNEAITMNNSAVDIVPSYKYLGVIIQDDLKWNLHVETQTKKASKRMYSVRRLYKLKIDNKILCLFYNSVVSSVLTYAITSWFDACDNNLEKTICKFHSKMCKMTNVSIHKFIEHSNDIYKGKCLSLIDKIVKDQDHVMHKYISVLPHGHLRSLKCWTERFKLTFMTVATRFYNRK